MQTRLGRNPFQVTEKHFEQEAPTSETLQVDVSPEMTQTGEVPRWVQKPVELVIWGIKSVLLAHAFLGVLREELKIT